MEDPRPPGHHRPVAEGHGSAHRDPQADAAVSCPASKAEKAKPPTVGADINDRDWTYFLSEWKQFKEYSRLEEWADIKYHLRQSLEDKLRKQAIDEGMDSWSSEAEMLQNLKKLAVQSQNPTVHGVKFLGLGQDRDEPIGNYVARLRGAAADCCFEVECSWSARTPPPTPSRCSTSR